MRSRRPAALALVFAASTLLSLLGVDLVLRFMGWPPERGPLAWKITVPWKDGINSLGFRAKEPAATRRLPRILLLGDSHLEGYHLTRRQTLGPRLKRHLANRGWPVEVVVMGAGGWGTDQQLIALQHYFETLQPDAVVVYYTHRNDLWNNLFPTHMGTPKPTYRLDDGALVPPDPALWRTPGTESGTAASFGIVPAVRRIAAGGYPTDLEWEQTLPPRQPAPTAEEDTPSLGAFYAEATGQALWDEEDLESERSHFAYLKDPPTPRLQYALALQGALLSEMKRFTEAQGVPLLFFRPQLPSETWSGTFAHRGRAYRLSGPAADARLRAVFEAAGVPLLEIDELELAHTWLPKDLHLNPNGNQFIAQQVGDWLLEQLPRPEPGDGRGRSAAGAAAQGRSSTQ